MKFLLSASAAVGLMSSASALACDCANPTTCPVGVCENTMSISLDVPIYSSAQHIWICNAGIINTGCAGDENKLFYKANKHGHDESGDIEAKSISGENVFGSRIYQDNTYFDTDSNYTLPIIDGINPERQEVKALTAALTSRNYGAHIFVDICGMSPFAFYDIPPDATGQDPDAAFSWLLKPSMTWASLPILDHANAAAYIIRAGLKWQGEWVCDAGLSRSWNPGVENLFLPSSTGQMFLTPQNLVSSASGTQYGAVSGQRKCIFRYHLIETNNGPTNARIKGETEGLKWTVKLDTHVVNTSTGD